MSPIVSTIRRTAPIVPGLTLSITFARKLTPSDAPHPISLPAFQTHPGLFELSVTTLIVPADTLGSRYHFDAGLRERIAARPPLPYPSLYESSSGKITGLDYTLLIDAGVTGEMRTIFGVQSRPASLREPLPAGFVAHAHL